MPPRDRVRNATGCAWSRRPPAHDAFSGHGVCRIARDGSRPQPGSTTARHHHSLVHSALSAHGNATAWRFPRRTHLAAPRPAFARSRYGVAGACAMRQARASSRRPHAHDAFSGHGVCRIARDGSRPPPASITARHRAPFALRAKSVWKRHRVAFPRMASMAPRPAVARSRHARCSCRLRIDSRRSRGSRQVRQSRHPNRGVGDPDERSFQRAIASTKGAAIGTTTQRGAACPNDSLTS